MHLIASTENLGFTCGNNLGYASSRGRSEHRHPPILTPNWTKAKRTAWAAALWLPPPHDSLWVLYVVIAEAPDIGMVGPQLRYPDGDQQSSVRRFPSPPTGFFESTWLGRFWRSNPWSRRMHMADWPVEYRHDVDLGNGRGPCSAIARR